ncbi:hypothetical protein FE257_000783 [Aspergillus nanangensis]|uniref:Uncharacterized protein n=1 Tax=Aspergillus nanangensis TaxID=2582783 RepID=A0AAD4CEX3_ASPNN|nr:hypothetical protein FE257_000783 [Aspergillus nanangensis]
MSPSRHLLLFLPLLVGTWALDRTTSTDANGNVVFAGRPVDIYNPLPTLIYNCDNIPSICANVGEYLAINGFQMGNGLEFHYDSLNKNTKRRRKQSCPEKGAWVTRYLNIPCGDNPVAPQVMPGSLSPTVGPLLNWPKPEFQMEIPNAAGDGPSGMRYTCDEFPAASWIEGGRNGQQPPLTNVYCSPKAVSCDSSVWLGVQARLPNYPNVASEQDWQGLAHRLLGGYGKTRGTQPVVMRFHFTTTNLSPIGQATAAQIVLPAYGANPARTAVANTKRDLDESLSGNYHCTGAFCEDLKQVGFSFQEPPPSSPSYQILKAERSETEPESPHATIHILAS